jgi:hypothetical protein
MSTDKHLLTAFVVIAASLVACGKEEVPPKPEPVKSAPAPAAPPPAPPAPVASAAPTEPKHDCPAGSTGDGSFDKPCEAKGGERMMEVTWNGKMGDAGPSFRVTNTSKLVILYGKVTAYFYDKSGKQLEVTGGSSGKPRQHQDCTGNIFGGVMNAGEKAVLTFSCLGKSHVPEGTAAIEAEMRMVGFADAEGKRNEFYWKNDDLAPDARPKGGLKSAAKKKK